MKSKKLVAIFMSALLTASAITAFASEEPPIAGASMRISVATLEEVVVQVTVPSEKELYINPLGFPVEMGEHTDNSQIIMESAYIENLGDTPVSVSVSVTGSLSEGSTMMLSSSSTKIAGLTSKKAFLYFEIQSVSDPDNVTWAKEFDAEKHIPVRIAVKTRKNIIELDAADGSNPYGAFRITGDCVAKPRTPWSPADGIKVVVAFTFKPVVTIS